MRKFIYPRGSIVNSCSSYLSNASTNAKRAYDSYNFICPSSFKYRTFTINYRSNMRGLYNKYCNLETKLKKIDANYSSLTDLLSREITCRDKIIIKRRERLVK